MHSHSVCSFFQTHIDNTCSFLKWTFDCLVFRLKALDCCLELYAMRPVCDSCELSRCGNVLHFSPGVRPPLDMQLQNTQQQWLLSPKWPIAKFKSIGVGNLPKISYHISQNIILLHKITIWIAIFPILRCIIENIQTRTSLWLYDIWTI